ncbi:hypothetical protein GBF35_31605 [Nonomuraea phyllanthi]|nr:hypothetical protein GBF35_31605 [Nonomuraea phyllanthi]
MATRRRPQQPTRLVDHGCSEPISCGWSQKRTRTARRSSTPDLLEDGDRLGRLDPAGAERCFSNLAFFESFSTLGRSREDLQRRLRESHVLVLGTGGLNSDTIRHLAGLGVGRLTLLDRDTVHSGNFARQYLYRWDGIGARKVERASTWVGDFDAAIEVEAIDTDVGGPEQLFELIARTRPDAAADGLLAAVALFLIFGIVWQWAALPLRGDSYALLANALRCHDLYRTTWLTAKDRLFRLAEAESAGPAETGERDRQVARWFVVPYVAGIAVMAWMLFTVVLPLMISPGGWGVAQLAGGEIGSETSGRRRPRRAAPPSVRRALRARAPFPRAGAVVRPAFLIGGTVGGMWHREIGVPIIEPLRPLPGGVTEEPAGEGRA